MYHNNLISSTTATLQAELLFHKENMMGLHMHAHFNTTTTSLRGCVCVLDVCVNDYIVDTHMVFSEEDLHETRDEGWLVHWQLPQVACDMVTETVMVTPIHSSASFSCSSPETELHQQSMLFGQKQPGSWYVCVKYWLLLKQTRYNSCVKYLVDHVWNIWLILCRVSDTVVPNIINVYIVMIPQFVCVRGQRISSNLYSLLLFWWQLLLLWCQDRCLP